MEGRGNVKFTSVTFIVARTFSRCCPLAAERVGATLRQKAGRNADRFT
jgi:hypothetical protein